MEDIKKALLSKFKTYRIIFWYDKDKKLSSEYEELDIEGVEKIHVCGNEFGVKYRLSKQDVSQKFLLYFDHEKPANEENWMLDLELAHYIFHTNREAMYMQEIGMNYSMQELVCEHIEFFNSKDRRQRLKEALEPIAGSTIKIDYSHDSIRNKMLAILFGLDIGELSRFIQAHGSEFIDGNNKYDKNLTRYNLKKYYWQQIEIKYNYSSPEPSIYDLLLAMFSSNFVLSKGNNSKANLNGESRIFLLEWKDTIEFKDGFDRLSAQVAVDMSIENKMQESSIDSIVDDNLFRLTDLKIISELTKHVLENSISLSNLDKIIKKRENKFWYNEFEAFYNCISYASKFIDKVNKNSTPKNQSFDEGIKYYSENLYELDFLYRKFVWSYRQTKQNRILENLLNRVEKIYANDWLLKYNNNWQQEIDKLKEWPFGNIKSQSQFYKIHVSPFARKKQRLFVIISDALRYECGVELNARLQKERRYESNIDYMVSSLPSYTQLGMASLLPHNKIGFKKGSDSVEVDTMLSNGIAGRTKILSTNTNIESTAIRADEFMSLNTGKQGRDFVKKYELIYIYHNGIDKTGDDKITEEKTFDAVEEEIIFLADIVKKIFNMNGNNIIITSDHGFLYQNNKLAESDYIESKHSGDVWKENRRFVIGNNLVGNNMTTAFTSQQLGLESHADVLIPKSINRLRVKGAGSRFVHGGASLQEIVIPLIKVSKTRNDTVSQVNIDILKSSDRITTNILMVSFMQKNQVGEKILPRTIRAGIYSEDGLELLSDSFNYIFDISEESNREREVKHKFQLKSEAGEKYKNKRVILKLEEPVEGTSLWKHYEQYYYTLNISFTSDF